MDEALRRICSERGVFLTREALKLGYDDRAVYRLVRRRELHRVRHGAYTFPDLWAEANERERHLLFARAAFRTAKAPVALSHTSAVLLHTPDFWNLDLRQAHLTRLDGKSGRKEAGVTQHRGKVTKDADVVERDFVKATNAARSALELMTIAPPEQCLVVVNGLLHSGQITVDGLRQAQQVMTHWPGSLQSDLVLRLADGRIESVGESRFFWLCWKQGLPAPEPQFRVHGGGGEVLARLDFAWPEHRFWVEFDGREKYVKFLRDGETPADAVLREKHREDLVRRVTGWRCIRITWADLANPRVTAAMIMREIARPAAA